MTSKTTIRQQRPHISVKIHRLMPLHFRLHSHLLLTFYKQHKSKKTQRNYSTVSKSKHETQTFSTRAFFHQKIKAFSFLPKQLSFSHL